jgi:3-isopropylmalate/(R)-2-methylmalate dehydratase small subunit
MKKNIKGKVFVLGDNIDTDQIIPAEYLVYSLVNEDEKKYYGKYALSGVPFEQSGLPMGNKKFVKQDSFVSEYNIIIAGNNFGCGSSREHAPFAMNIAGVELVIASSFARIFYRNSIDGGFLVPLEAQEYLVNNFKTNDEVEVDLENYEIKNLTSGKVHKLFYPGTILSIIEAGGLFKYAKENNLF